MSSKSGSTKIPRNERKGKPKGKFHRNKKACQYKECACRAYENGDTEEGRVNTVLSQVQHLNQLRHEHHLPVEKHEVAIVRAHIDEYEQALSPAQLC